MKTKYPLVRRLASLMLLAAAVPAARATDVANETDLRNAAAANAPAIKVTGNITLTLTPLVISAASSLDFQPGCKLLKGASTVDVIINGPMPNRPEHFFAKGTTYEWQPGDIRGLMGKTSTAPGADRLPEWWGALSGGYTSAPAPEDDARAINCAVGAVCVDSTGGTPAEPYTVQLGSGIYYISCPVILTNTKCTFRGRSSFNTGLVAYVDANSPAGWRWSDHKSKFSWMQRVSPLSSTDKTTTIYDNVDQVAMVYIGGAAFSGSNPHFQKARNADPAAALTNIYDLGLQPVPQASLPGTPMSLISSLHNSSTTSSSLQTGTVLQNINGGSYTGYGVGFCQSTTVNDLTLHSFHMNNYGADATYTGHPIFLPVNTRNCRIVKGTIGAGYHKTNGLLDLIGILAQGTNVQISDIHIEHCHAGVDIIASPIGYPPTTVTVTNVDYFTADPSFGTLNGVVRIRGAGAEDETPLDAQVVAKVTNSYAQNHTTSLALLYEPGAPFASSTGRVLSSDAPGMAFYSRLLSGGALTRRGPLW
jgi:hypothetical protein